MNSSAALKTLVVGGRGVGAVHIAALDHISNASVVAVAGSSGPTAKAVAQRLGIARWSGDYRQLVADPSIDVVHVCTPNDLHFAVVKDALLAGKHVVCEKPVAATVADAVELVRLAHNAPGQAFLCYKYRYLPLLQRLRALVAGGGLGKVHAVRGHYLQSWKLTADPANWRCDPERAGFSPVLLDIGTHLVDLVEHAVNASATSPYAQIGDTRGNGLAQGNVLFQAGTALGNIVVSQVSPGNDNHLRLQIDGAEASATWTYDQYESLILTRQAGLTRLDTDVAGSPRQVTTTGWESYQDPLASAIALFQAVYDQLQVSDPDTRPPQLADGLRHLRFFSEAWTSRCAGRALA